MKKKKTGFIRVIEKKNYNNMDRAKKARKLIRTNITKLCKKIYDEMNQETPDLHQIMAFREDLHRLAENMQTEDKVIIEEIFEKDCTDQELEKESEEAEKYQSTISTVKIKINELVKSVDCETSSSVASNATVLNGSAKKTYKLPKIEIKKFNGELLEWLSFWSQFEKIHEDSELHDSDKFQYLTQAMVEDTRASDLVKSYPQTSDNYAKVVEALTNRFGKKKILQQVYVRELIKMIATNVKTNDKIPVTALFDKLESHLRALESLDITVDQTSVFLFPMVESSLPEDILIAWQRSVILEKRDRSKNHRKRNWTI